MYMTIELTDKEGNNLKCKCNQKERLKSIKM